jgi:hypothetical protein
MSDTISRADTATACFRIDIDTPRPAPVAWRRPPEAPRTATRDDRGWNFAMDWYIVPPEPSDPTAPPTPADLAYDRVAGRIRRMLRRRVGDG